MHNLHLIVISAENGKEACDEVESIIEDWGNQDNWKSMCGAVSQDNEVYLSGEGRYAPDEETNTIDKLNKFISNHIKETKESIDNTLNELFSDTKSISDLEISKLYRLSNTIQDLINFKYYDEHKQNTEFNILEETFNSDSYDKFGVSDLTYETREGSKLWVVFVDVHS